MKKLFACLLVVVMLCTAASAFAEAPGLGRFGKSNALTKFLMETDTQAKDIALQVQSEGKVSDLVIRVDGDNIHLVSRNDDVVDGHVQINPTGIYVGADGKVTLLRYATVATFAQTIARELEAILDEAIKSVPEEKAPTEAEIRQAQAEIKQAVSQLAILASAAEAQEQADAATLSSAALAFIGKFKPENILDVKEEDGGVQISLRSEAFASALADAMDELMSNPALAELVDRTAALEGGNSFAAYQKNWIVNREATLEAIRTIESTETIEENGHMTSHFQIGEELPETKILVCDTDSWIDAENGNVAIAVALGFKDEDPLMVYELAADQYSYSEKLTAGDSMAEVYASIEDNRVVSGRVVGVIEGTEALRVEFGPDYLYMKGPKGGFSTSVRMTWTGKTRYELVGETADGEQDHIIVDFYEDDDSLICELNTNKSDEPAMFKISRIDRADIEDLSASKDINEITVDKINAELESLLKSITRTTR